MSNEKRVRLPHNLKPRLNPAEINSEEEGGEGEMLGAKGVSSRQYMVE